MGKDTEELLAKLMARLPWHVRMRVRFKLFGWQVNSRAGRYVPGVRRFQTMLWRIKRQGISGAWEPAFDIRKQDKDIWDKRLRWHGWGVLKVGVSGSYRAYTPTRYSGPFVETPREAWEALERVYYGRPPAQGDIWIKRSE